MQAFGAQRFPLQRFIVIIVSTLVLTCYQLSVVIKGRSRCAVAQILASLITTLKQPIT